MRGASSEQLPAMNGYRQLLASFKPNTTVVVMLIHIGQHCLLFVPCIVDQSAVWPAAVCSVNSRGVLPSILSALKFKGFLQELPFDL